MPLAEQTGTQFFSLSNLQVVSNFAPGPVPGQRDNVDVTFEFVPGLSRLVGNPRLQNSKTPWKAHFFYYDPVFVGSLHIDKS